MKIQGLYILECANGAFYVGSSKDILKRLDDHNAGLGANFTRKNGPCKLVYFEEYSRISEAFQREQQIKGWSRKKKECLISRLRNGKAGI
ncbi:MAG: GIY-YIG nuclease family protein [Flavobacteriales bacterium]|jgi:putative endonuclease